MIMGQTIDKFSVSFPPFQKQVYVYGIFVVQIFSYLFTENRHVSNDTAQLSQFSLKLVNGKIINSNKVL